MDDYQEEMLAALERQTQEQMRYINNRSKLTNLNETMYSKGYNFE